MNMIVLLLAIGFGCVSTLPHVMPKHQRIRPKSHDATSCGCNVIAFYNSSGILGSAAYSYDGCEAVANCPAPTVDMHYNAAGSRGSIALNRNGGRTDGITVNLSCIRGGWNLQAVVTSGAQKVWGGDPITDIECGSV